jgi:diguanylate cyclase (GGDEF)-like protein/PAS domain S-box-containing protein
METLLRVLIVEDAPEDAGLIVLELERKGYRVESRRVDRAAALRDALESARWDVVISDYEIPGFGGLQALQMVRELAPYQPFLMISGRVGEEAAAGAIRAGADDFLLKGKLSRLPAAIERSMADCAARKERHLSQEELRERLEFIQVLIDTLPTPIFYNDPNGLYLGCNKAFEEQIGLKRGEILNMNVCDLFPPDLASLYTGAKETAGSEPRTFEGSITCADGESRDMIFYSAIFNRSGSSSGGVVGALLDISDRKRSEVKLRYLSTHDMLTGIYNRAYFDEELDRLKKGRKFPVSIVMADVDRLKEANDHLGHAAGDELLRHAAEVFRGAFRGDDVAARIGGDEFAAILPNTDESALTEALERLQAALILNNAEHPENPLSLSIGAATAHSGEELMAAWRTADQNMYGHKKGRRSLSKPQAPVHPHPVRERGEYEVSQS